jgi:hypothetical protein
LPSARTKIVLSALLATRFTSSRSDPALKSASGMIARPDKVARRENTLDL